MKTSFSCKALIASYIFIGTFVAATIEARPKEQGVLRVQVDSRELVVTKSQLRKTSFRITDRPAVELKIRCQRLKNAIEHSSWPGFQSRYVIFIPLYRSLDSSRPRALIPPAYLYLNPPTLGEAHDALSSIVPARLTINRTRFLLPPKPQTWHLDYLGGTFLVHMTPSSKKGRYKTETISQKLVMDYLQASRKMAKEINELSLRKVSADQNQLELNATLQIYRENDKKTVEINTNLASRISEMNKARMEIDNQLNALQQEIDSVIKTRDQMGSILDAKNRKIDDEKARLSLKFPPADGI